MESLYVASIPAISGLQSALIDHSSVLQFISVLFDPKYAFLVYSPIMFAIDYKIGRKLMLTTVLAEWSNQVLKWFLHGERPYWYVHTSGQFDTAQTPIHQFPVTCELGPGDPSGHAMVTAAVWYIIISSFFDLDPDNSQHPDASPVFRGMRTRHHKIMGWSLYVSLILMVSVSRVFLACHFPHQCLGGACIGILLAKLVSSCDFLQLRKRHFISLSIMMFVSAFGAYALLQAMGVDPSWTIQRAMKWCARREYIHLDTAPFFSIMRYVGFCLGAGVGLSSPLFKHVHHSATATSKMPLLTAKRVGASVAISTLSLVTAKLIDNIGHFISHSNIVMFYACVLVAYALFSFAIVALYPYFVDRFMFKYTNLTTTTTLDHTLAADKSRRAD